MKTAEIRSLLKYIIVITISLFTLIACTGDNEDDLPANVDYALLEYINEPYTPYEPEIGAAIPKTSAKALKSASLPYPPFNPHDIKTVGPEGWGNRQQLVNTGIGGVKFNLIWSQWQPDPNLRANAPNTFSYDGKVWRVSSSREKQIRWYSDRGIKVTAVIYGTPKWARRKNTAKVANVKLIDDKFIAPDNPEDFARFAGMLAKRFNGANGNGRIVNFVVQNEVNALDWYNPGCGHESTPCTIEDRIDSYAELFNLTYDRIKAEQEHAKVMFSFDHHFGPAYNKNQRFTSAKKFIEALDKKVGDRKWRMAFHSYPPNLRHPEFGPYDYPKITFGNLGVLAGYLRQTFPNKPHTWDIHLTENGINSGSPSSEGLMQKQLKVATRNVLGTPGIETFYYHRLEDHHHEGTFTPGLFSSRKKPKKAWSTWATNNLYNAKPARLDDGYELLPYVRLERSKAPGKGHWASTRQAPDGYVTEESYLLLREPVSNTTLLYECHSKEIKVTFISAGINCNGHENFGPVGYIFKTNNASGSREPLYRIKLADTDFILSNNPSEGNGDPTLLGYVDKKQTRKQPAPAANKAYFSTRDGTFNPPANNNNDNDNDLPNNTDSSTPDDTANGSGQAAKVAGVLGPCMSDGSTACAFLKFSSQAGQSDLLRCKSRPDQQTTIRLNYGNNKSSSAENVVNNGSNQSDRYDITLEIPDDATWASVSINRESGSVAECSVVTEGGLQIGAAIDQVTDNLLYNGSFEYDISDWQFCEEVDSDSFTDDAQDGSRAVEIANNNCLFQEVDIISGGEYTMTCQARNDETSSDQASLRFAIANNSYQTLADDQQSITDSDYQPYTSTLIAPEHATHAVLSFQTAGLASIDNCTITAVSDD